jgi:hypothetical protein
VGEGASLVILVVVVSSKVVLIGMDLYVDVQVSTCTLAFFEVREMFVGIVKLSLVASIDLVGGM